MFTIIFYVCGFTASVIICSELPYYESDKKGQDMYVDKERFIQTRQNNLSPRSFVSDKRRHWPNGVVPYVIDDQFSEKQKSMILKATQIFGEISCVRWVPWTGERDRVNISWTAVHNDCHAHVGRIKGSQTIALGNGCFRQSMKGTLEHEMMHAMGFVHEHQRPDRDCHVWINRTDVFGKEPVNFAIYQFEQIDDNFPYDINSIMHYRFIVGLRGKISGNEFGILTPLDIMKINNMYCGGPNYCKLFPRDCRKFAQQCKPLSNKYSK